MVGHIGTYASPESLGVYRFDLDPATGALGTAKLWLEAPDAKYVAVQDGLVAAPVRRGDRAGLLVAGPEGGVLGEVLAETVPSCFVVWRGERLFTANYHEGAVLIYRWDGGLRLEKRLDIAPRAGCHQVLFHGSTLLVPCLELDQVRLFDMDRGYAPLGTIPFPAGTGPRHGVFRGDTLFLVSERSNQLFTIGAPGWDLRDVQTIVPGPAATAAVRLSPDGRSLYVSTREADRITVFRVDGPRPELVQQTGCGGVHPRDILPTPDGAFLLVLNRSSNQLISFSLDRETGKLGQICARAAVHEGVALALEERMI